MRGTKQILKRIESIAHRIDIDAEMQSDKHNRILTYLRQNQLLLERLTKLLEGLTTEPD